MSQNNRQVGGKHYLKQRIQHWDYVLANEIPYMEAQIIKYVGRHRDKNGIEDLRKAAHFLDKLIEQELQGQKAGFFQAWHAQARHAGMEQRDTDLHPATGPNASLDVADDPPSCPVCGQMAGCGDPENCPAPEECLHSNMIRSPDGAHVCVDCGAAIRL